MNTGSLLLHTLFMLLFMLLYYVKCWFASYICSHCNVVSFNTCIYWNMAKWSTAHRLSFRNLEIYFGNWTLPIYMKYVIDRHLTVKWVICVQLISPDCPIRLLVPVKTKKMCKKDWAHLRSRLPSQLGNFACQLWKPSLPSIKLFYFLGVVEMRCESKWVLLVNPFPHTWQRWLCALTSDSLHWNVFFSHI